MRILSWFGRLDAPGILRTAKRCNAYCLPPAYFGSLEESGPDQNQDRMPDHGSVYPSNRRLLKSRATVHKMRGYACCRANAPMRSGMYYLTQIVVLLRSQHRN